MGALGFFAILRVFCIGVALLPVGQYALWLFCHFARLLHWDRAFARWAIRALAFLPFCASSALASPRGRRERTLVRPLALGLAALNTHQTDKKAFVTRYVALLHTRFGRAMSLCSIRALVALCRFAPYALLARLCAHWRCAHTPRVAPPPTPLPIGAGELNPCAIRESGQLAVVMAPCALMDWR